LNSLNSKKNSKKSYNYSSDEEEVLAFDEDEDEDEDEEEEGDESMESGDENDDDNKIDDDNEYSSSWGVRKSSYYQGNKLKDHEDALLEEEEANRLQEKMMKQLDSADFGLDAFQIDDESTNDLKTTDQLRAKKIASMAFGESFDNILNDNKQDLRKITKNLNEMTKQEKLDILKQESPELFELIKEFKNKVTKNR
jgi:U3 small nucleolar RNA-associated protein 3